MVASVNPPPDTSDREEREERVARLSRLAESRLPLFSDDPPPEQIANGLLRLLRAMAKGVSYDHSKNKWRVRASFGKGRKAGVTQKRQHLGWFSSEAEAIRAALTWSPPVDDSS